MNALPPTRQAKLKMAHTFGVYHFRKGPAIDVFYEKGPFASVVFRQKIIGKVSTSMLDFNPSQPYPKSFEIRRATA